MPILRICRSLIVARPAASGTQIFESGGCAPIHRMRFSVGSVIKKRRKRMAKKKHRKLLRKTRHQRRNKK